VNERIEDLNESFATVTETFKIVCECGECRLRNADQPPTLVVGDLSEVGH
jgi:hypothetical protein